MNRFQRGPGRTVGGQLGEILTALRPLSDALRALSESPAVRALSAALGAFRSWAERPEVRTALRAIHEWATVDRRLQGYRDRWEFGRIPITVQEAEDELRCLRYAAFNKPVDPVQYLVHELGNSPAEDEIRRYVERAELEVRYWDALVRYKDTLTERGGGMPPTLSDWPLDGAERPDARGRPPRWLFRNEVLIPKAIQKLEGCGLPVTSQQGDSLAKAVANVFGLTERNVAAIWEGAPTRTDKCSRRRYADQPCRICGHPKVPTWRAQRDDFRCERCTPSFF